MHSPLEDLFKDFFGDDFGLERRRYRQQPQQSTGSGVVLSGDGYIVTNSHVIDKAEQIEITLDDNRKYTAKLIGQDRDTDLALLKIQEKDLAHLPFGSSDDLQIGEFCP